MSSANVQKPIALILLQLPYDILNLVRSVLAFVLTVPVTLFCAVTSPFVTSDALFSIDHLFTAIFFFWLRWLLSIIAFALYSLQFIVLPFCMFYFVHIKALSQADAAPTSIPLLLGYLASLIFTFDIIFNASSGSIDSSYWNSAWESQLDMLRAMCTLLNICLVIRFHKLFSWPFDSSLRSRFGTSYLLFTFTQLFLSLLDWISLPFYLVALLTIYKFDFIQPSALSHPMHHYSDDSQLDRQFELRWNYVKVAFEIVTDLLCLIVLGIPIIATIWRARSFLRELHREDIPLTCARHFANLLIDIPCLLMGFIVTVTVLRAYSLWSRVTRENMREMTSKYFAILFIDIPCIAMFLVICLTVYRFSSLKSRFKRLSKHRIFGAHFSVMLEFVNLIIDIPFFACALVVTCTLVRLFHLVNDVFVRIPIDVEAHAPRLETLMSSTDTSTQQATKTVVVVDYDSVPLAEKMRFAAFNQLVLLIMDIPATVMILFVLVTVWRSNQVFNRLLKLAQSEFTYSVCSNKQLKSLTHQEAITMINAIASDSNYICVATELFIEWLCDFPFLVMLLITSVITPYRSYFIYRESMCNKQDPAVQPRMIILGHFLCSILLEQRQEVRATELYLKNKLTKKIFLHKA